MSISNMMSSAMNFANKIEEHNKAEQQKAEQSNFQDAAEALKKALDEHKCDHGQSSGSITNEPDPKPEPAPRKTIIEGTDREYETITNEDDNVVINGNGGYESIINKGSDVIINGNGFISNTGNDVEINGGGYIRNYGDNVTITGRDDRSNQISSFGGNITVKGGNKGNRIVLHNATGENKVEGGDKKDTIKVFGENDSVNSINAGAGEDIITTGDRGTYNIVDEAGSGNDIYTLGKGVDNITFDALLRGEGDRNGNDVIENFDTTKDTIELKNLTSQGRNNVTYKQEDNGDVTITYGDGDTITVKDANVDEVKNSVIFS